MDQPGTRIQWGQAFVVLSMIVLSWWTATQWTAWELAFQPELGRPWFTVLHRWPVYAPPLFFWWWYEFDAYAPAVFARGAWIAGSGGVLAFAAAVALSVHRAREAQRAATYGSARWAEDAEIRAAGLLGEDGVVLGKYRWAYLRHDGPEHVLIFAPTRTGKGVGMVIPTLLTWPGSAIIHDIKGENWQITAGFRATFGRVLLFDPTNPTSSAYNPLLEVRRGASEVMQLPARDEVVMVAGCPPIRARKARYFRDRRFVERVLPPPDPTQLARPVRSDDWSGRALPATQPPEKTSAAEPDRPDDADSDESLGTGRKWSREHDPAETGKRKRRAAPDLFGAEPSQDPEARDRADLTRIARQAGLDRGNDLGL